MVYLRVAKTDLKLSSQKKKIERKKKTELVGFEPTSQKPVFRGLREETELKRLPSGSAQRVKEGCNVQGVLCKLMSVCTGEQRVKCWALLYSGQWGLHHTWGYREKQGVPGDTEEAEEE